ncbi:MAG: alpha/beta hydrolase, partial [Pseudomonadota bacterium]
RRELTLGSPSLGWLDAAFREMRALQGAGPLPIPSLLLLGEEEAVVSPAAIEARADDPGARLVRLAGARHEPLMEAPNGAVGRPARAAMTAFLDDLGL